MKYRFITQGTEKAFNLEGTGYPTPTDAVRAAATALAEAARRFGAQPEGIVVVAKKAKPS